jgi:hypothetical protein
MVRMTRLVAGFSLVLLFCGSAIAQDPALASASAVDQPAVIASENPVLRQFQKIEDSWSDAINQRDQYGLELVLSPSFVDIAANGEITTRNQQLAQVVTGEDKTLHLTQRAITARQLGDIAVVNGTYTLHHKAVSGHVDEKGVYTHIYERSRGGWLCINSQRTVLREDSSAKPKKQTAKKQSDKKESGAELPFHIPLFSRHSKTPAPAQTTAQ